MRRVEFWLVSVALATLCAGGVAAQTGDAESDYPQVEVELGGTLFKQVLPFDVPFFI